MFVSWIRMDWNSHKPMGVLSGKNSKCVVDNLKIFVGVLSEKNSTCVVDNLKTLNNFKSRHKTLNGTCENYYLRGTHCENDFGIRLTSESHNSIKTWANPMLERNVWEKIRGRLNVCKLDQNGLEFPQAHGRSFRKELNVCCGQLEDIEQLQNSAQNAERNVLKF